MNFYRDGMWKVTVSSACQYNFLPQFVTHSVDLHSATQTCWQSATKATLIWTKRATPRQGKRPGSPTLSGMSKEDIEVPYIEARILLLHHQRDRQKQWCTLCKTSEFQSKGSGLNPFTQKSGLGHDLVHCNRKETERAAMPACVY